MLKILILVLLATNALADSIIIGGSSGGSGTPGGSDSQLQYNNSGSFEGVSGSGVDSNGNVGIGSANPGTKLDVIGTVRASAFQGAKTSTPNIVFNSNTGTNTLDSSYWFGVSGDDGNDADDKLQIGIGTTNASPVLTMAPNGNVGIGTTATSQNLVVGDNISILNAIKQHGTATQIDVDPYQSVRFGRSTNNGSFVISIFKGDASANIQHNFLGNGNSYLINQAGNLGVGPNQVTPRARIAVAGNIGIGTVSSSAYLSLNIPSGVSILAEQNVGIGTHIPSTLLEVGARKFNVATGGNVGIGTWSAHSGALQIGITDHSSQTACIGTGNCLGYCSGGLGAVCGSCTCLPGN